ncbi:MAG: DUF2800 domain-containing protein [Ruthenibacterium lactatiformans]
MGAGSVLTRHSRPWAGRPGTSWWPDAACRTEQAEVIRTATEAGFTDIYKTTLLGVGDLEKRMGRKKFSEVLGKYVVKPVGAPQLVPESDPRKPYSDAASDFSS